MTAIRAVLADDAVLVREAVAGLLRDAGVEVVAQAGNPDDLHAAVARTHPDIALVDIRMPPTWRMEGMQAAVRIRREHPGVGVLVLSQYLEPPYVSMLVGQDARGVGYLLKERVSSVGSFLDAVRRVAGGGCAFDPSVVEVMVGQSQTASRLAGLSPRELEVLALIAEGLSNQGIARRLQVSAKTVESHVRSILVQLDLGIEDDYHRRVLATLAYLRASGAAGH